MTDGDTQSPSVKRMCHSVRAGSPYCMAQVTQCRAGRPSKLHKVKRGTPSRSLRETTPFKTLAFFPFFLSLPLVSQKKRNAGFKGGGLAFLARRCAGLCPPNKPLSWAIAFCSLGRQNLFGPPLPVQSAFGANVHRWVRVTQISNFCEIEFSHLTPLLFNACA